MKKKTVRRIKENLPSMAEAKRLLKLGVSRGLRLTKAQRDMFRMIASGKRPKRVRNNPPISGQKKAAVMYARVGGFWAQKGKGHACDPKCLDADHWYEHVFTEDFPMIGLPKGARIGPLTENRILI